MEVVGPYVGEGIFEKDIGSVYRNLRNARNDYIIFVLVGGTLSGCLLCYENQHILNKTANTIELYAEKTARQTSAIC